MVTLYATLDAAIAAVDADQAFIRALDWNLTGAISHLESTLAPFPGMTRRGQA